MRQKTSSIFAWLTLACALALAGCDDGGGSRGLKTVIVPCGFGGAFHFDLTCSPAIAGMDGVCTFIVESRNTGVVSISDTVVAVLSGQTVRVDEETIANKNGHSVVTVTDELGNVQEVGTLAVVDCSV
jgi:hypothetical protein